MGTFIIDMFYYLLETHKSVEKSTLFYASINQTIVMFIYIILCEFSEFSHLFLTNRTLVFYQILIQTIYALDFIAFWTHS